MITRVCLVQPPFTQLNGPYPSVYYLRAFLERRGCAVTVRDDSIGLFETIFCRAGLERIFADAKKTVTGNPGPIVGRFLSEERLWLHSIDRIIAFLRGADHEWGHCIALANGLLPGGPRYDARLAGIRAAARDAAMEDAPLLASALLADIADFITVTLDRGFSLIRYASSAAGASAGFRDFSTVQAGLNGYIMNRFYRPLLEAAWQKLDGDSPLLLGVTIPFPGCLAGALVCAESAKARFGGAVITVAGGGYVNTELRFITEKKWFDYFDYLSLDRGYGALDAIINHRPAAKIIMSADAVDDDAARTVFPDYSGVDFSRYIRPVDDANPMHRLWSDGRWLKAYTAHGCYWHNCAFCDTGLDYIRRYLPVDVDALFRHLTAQAEKTGARGVHLVDEA
jgi:hypothetical protein